MPTGETHVPFFLSGLCVVGGIIGFTKSRSTMSLVGGGGVGALYAASGYMIQQNNAEQGHLLGLGTSLLLAGMMGRRFGRTGVFMPAGALAGVGASGALYHGLKYKEWKGY